MSTAVTQPHTVQRTALLAQASAGEIFALICAAVLLLSFVALPWVVEAENTAAGVSLITSERLPISDELRAAFTEFPAVLLLLPAGGLLGFAAVIAGLYAPRYARRASWVAQFAGLMGMAYFVLFAIQDRANTTYALSQFSGGGFWLAFFATALLFFGFFAGRPAPSQRIASYSARVGFGQRIMDRLAAWPLFSRALAYIFRFQSFFGLIIVILLAIIFSPVRNDTNLFLSQRNLSNVARDVAETGVLATGQILVIIVGGIDLSVGSVVALTATGVAFLLMRDLVPAIPAILIILGLGLGIGWWNGWTSERFRIPAFVTTLAMLSIARGVARIWSDSIAVPLSYGAGGADPLFRVIGERINGIFPVPAIIMFVVAIVMSLVLHYTAFGRHLYAIGGNQTAARLSGLAVSRIKIIAFMLCGFFASMAGIMHAAQLNQGSPNEAVNYELNAIAAVVIGGASLSGGRGTVIGAIAGAFILGILDNMLSLNNVNSNIQLVTKGLLVVAAVALQQLRPRQVE